MLSIRGAKLYFNFAFMHRFDMVYHYLHEVQKCKTLNIIKRCKNPLGCFAPLEANYIEAAIAIYKNKKTNNHRNKTTKEYCNMVGENLRRAT